MYCTQKNSKRRRRTCIQLKILCFWSKMSAVLQRTQSPRTCLLLYRAIDVHTSAPALLKLGTSNITESLLQMGYCFLNWSLLWLLEIAEDKPSWAMACTCCYLLVTANFPTTFLVIHNWIRHRYCKRITANTSNNKIISIIQTKGSFLIIERSAFFFLIVLFHRYTSFLRIENKTQNDKASFSYNWPWN